MGAGLHSRGGSFSRAPRAPCSSLGTGGEEGAPTGQAVSESGEGRQQGAAKSAAESPHLWEAPPALLGVQPFPFLGWFSLHHLS